MEGAVGVRGAHNPDLRSQRRLPGLRVLNDCLDLAG